MSTSPARTDPQRLIRLLADVAAGQQSALEQLYQCTSAQLFGLALRILGKQEWAEDVLQETYLNIWRFAGDYQAGLSAPMTWMGTILRNRALDYLRRAKVEREDTHQELDETLAEILASDTPNPEQLLNSSQNAQALAHCLEDLEQKQRQAISLAYLKDMSHVELATLLAVPLGTVKSWIRRGLDKLRGCLEAAI